MNQQTESLQSMEKPYALESTLGRVPYDEHDIIDFDEGLFGYEDEHQYIIYENQSYYPFCWLISIHNPNLMFPIINPKELVPDYKPEIENPERWDLLINIVSIGKTISDVTVNLRAPVLMNKKTRKAKQTILTDSNYSLRHFLFK